MLIYLPRATHVTLPTAGSAASAGVQSGADAHILVVDDDAAVRWVTVECLREAGYRVAEAGGDLWLQKPFKARALAEAVSRALR